MIYDLVMKIQAKEFNEFLSNIEDSIGTSNVDLDMLQWIIEDTYDEKFKKNKEYFEDNRDLLIEFNLEVFDELNRILKRLTEIEHYEKCAIVKKCIDQFLLQFPIK